MNELNELYKVIGIYVVIMICITYIFVILWCMPIINRHIINETGIKIE